MKEFSQYCFDFCKLISKNLYWFLLFFRQSNTRFDFCIFNFSKSRILVQEILPFNDRLNFLYILFSAYTYSDRKTNLITLRALCLSFKTAKNFLSRACHPSIINLRRGEVCDRPCVLIRISRLAVADESRKPCPGDIAPGYRLVSDNDGECKNSLVINSV